MYFLKLSSNYSSVSLRKEQRAEEKGWWGMLLVLVLLLAEWMGWQRTGLYLACSLH